ncbi:uncharacterized protein LOC113502624 [Trichoplusia ni]|uniref:Uncharacterized protein LOC113502589 n=1 Tax=Trichoplusia ni TaxID=7111 RepID=A0A7E5WH19_TRINI|nr:uncharacterized protein LOC113502589 [Trichoplusia ni]XP_026740077.1 uncharacterized protein LOC113502624 [Trichoplusia ni]
MEISFKMSLDMLTYAFLLSFATGALGSVIIPEELPSLLSVAYSNIPPIKKGTDSRVGFGFAFGNHADFQVMFELGPQTNTQNLTGQGFQSSSSNAKRQANSPPPKLHKNKEKYQTTDGSNYLQNWAQKMKYPPKSNQHHSPRPGEVPNLEESMVELIKNEKGEYEIHQPQPGNLPQNILEDLKKLYKLKSEVAKKMTAQNAASSQSATSQNSAVSQNSQKRSEEEVKKITEDLSNVDLD